MDLIGAVFFYGVFLGLVSVVVMVAVVALVKIEQVEEVADGGHVGWDVGIVVLKPRIGQIVSAAAAERSVEPPVAFDEFHERGVLGIDVADVAAL